MGRGRRGRKEDVGDYVYALFPSPTNFSESGTWNIMNTPCDFKGWLPTMLALVNIANYAEYKASCIAHGVPIGYIMTIGTYAECLGFLKMAINRYPDLSPESAYWEFMKRNVENTPNGYIAREHYDL